MALCIYSDSNAANDELNEEHIFPLTLGGNNLFTVKVLKKYNTRANQEIDEKLKSCLFMAASRKAHEAKGHRKREVAAPKAKIAVGPDQSVALKFNDTGQLSLYSNRNKRFLVGEDIKSKKVLVNFKVDRNIRFKFTAKVALGSGYFVFGDAFVENVDLSELRTIMNYHGELHNEADFNRITSTGWFWPKQVGDNDSEMHAIFEAINSMFSCSFVAIITSAVQDKVIFVVGVLGQLTGVISCPANCEKLPKYGDFDLGHVVALKGSELQRMSYRECLAKLPITLDREG